ncbi:hypothetical protein ACFVEN_07560 [Streptomyces sp. NPDC057681]|uniref:hypothetical protein n=1 Tax=Streptomyces sp. NPDC057681 TaxID=3346209 RepID=UPI00369EFE7A
MTSPAADEDEVQIRRIFGNGFVDWVLAVDGPDRTPEQGQVAEFIHRASKEQFPESAHVSGYLRLSNLTLLNPETGRTGLAELRRLAGGRDPAPGTSGEDETLAALQAWAGENFGGLLLEEGGFGTGWGSASRERMTRAVAADPELPFHADSNETDGMWHITSIGSAGSFQLAFLGPSIVAAALRQAATRKTSILLNDLLAELPAALSVARAVHSGENVDALAMAGLSGVLLPTEKEVLSAPWGRVRITYETDNLILAKEPKLSSMTQADGTTIVSRGTGDLTIETTVPWSSEFAEMTTDEEVPPSRAPSTARDLLQRRVLDVRLAFALTMADPQAPALLPTWAKIENPISVTSDFSFTEIAKLRHRTPTRLSVEQAEEWERWISVLDCAELDNLGHAPQRLLRAMTEREDPVDALVDAVIVWESIFGTHSEITFRVCASLAKLLCVTLEERLAFLKKAKGVYTMRSKIVHGASDIRPERTNEARDEALRVAIQALRALTQDRPDLLSLRSGSERSDRILLE